MKQKILWVVIMVGVVGYMLFGVNGFAFNQSKFKLQVLPLNCQFDVIDTGTNEIKYLTPVECGEQPASQDPIDDPSQGSGTQSPTTPVDARDESTATSNGFGGGWYGDDQDSMPNDDSMASYLRDRSRAQPRTTRDIVVLTGMIIVAGIATDVLLLNGWVGQRLSQRLPFSRRRG